MNESPAYIPFSEAAKFAPRRPTYGTIWRWAQRGLTQRNGVRINLRSVRVGGRLYTTEQWLRQFFDQVAEADLQTNVIAHPQRHDGQPMSAVHELADVKRRKK